MKVLIKRGVTVKREMVLYLASFFFSSILASAFLPHDTSALGLLQLWFLFSKASRLLVSWQQIPHKPVCSLVFRSSVIWLSFLTLQGQNKQKKKKKIRKKSESWKAGLLLSSLFSILKSPGESILIFKWQICFRFSSHPQYTIFG